MTFVLTRTGNPLAAGNELQTRSNNLYEYHYGTRSFRTEPQSAVFERNRNPKTPLRDVHKTPNFP